MRNEAQLTQDKTVDKQTAAVGETLTYTVTIANHGTGDAIDVIAHDVLPPNLAVASADTGGLGAFDSATGVWTIPLLPAGRTATLTLVVTVGSGASGQTLTNQLFVTPEPTTVDDPCPTDPARSCATTAIAGPSGPPPTATPGPGGQPPTATPGPGAPSGTLPFTGFLLTHYIIATVALLGAGTALILMARRGRLRGRHFTQRT